MPEQIHTFSDEELAEMFKSGEMKVLITPNLPIEKTEHEKALEKAKELFGRDFEDVFTIEIGGKSVDQLKQELQEANRHIMPWAMELLDSPKFTTLPNIQNVELIKLKVMDLGFKDKATAEKIYEKAQSLGLGFCPAEVGQDLMLKDADQLREDWYIIAVKPIPDRFGVLTGFCLEDRTYGLSLDGFYIDSEQNPSTKFVFRI